MAADKIDMSLDDIIKMDGISGVKRGQGAGGAARRGGGNNNTNSGGGGGGGNNNNNNRGAMRNKMNRNSVRAAPYSRASRIPDQWQHDMFDGPSRGGASGSNHLLVSNLDYGVSDKDIRDLFVEFGGLKKAAVHYDRSGRSLGTADVIFEKRSDAAAAMKQYNGVLLDGRPMKITIVPSSTGDNQQQQRRSAPTSSGAGNFRSQKFGNSRGGGSGIRQNQQQQRNRNRGAGGNSGGGGGANNNNANRGPRRNNQNRKPVTAEELDADLDAYVNK